MPFYSFKFDTINLVRWAKRNKTRIFILHDFHDTLPKMERLFFIPLRITMGFWSVTSRQRQYIFALFHSFNRHFYFVNLVQRLNQKKTTNNSREFQQMKHNHKDMWVDMFVTKYKILWIRKNRSSRVLLKEF